jgi:hypothetical protein
MAPEDLDMSTSAGWMEWIERTENRSHDSGGAGAYDTFRCDLQLDKSEDRWRIWGQDFHLRRLQESFRSIGPNRSPESTQKALKLSEEMVQALLQQAENSEILQTARPQADCDAHIQLLRLDMPAIWFWNAPTSVAFAAFRAHAFQPTARKIARAFAALNAKVGAVAAAVASANCIEFGGGQASQDTLRWLCTKGLHLSGSQASALVSLLQDGVGRSRTRISRRARFQIHLRRLYR